MAGLDTVPTNVGKSAIECVNEAMDFTERVKDTDFKTTARYADHRDVMIDAIEEAGDAEDEDEDGTVVEAVTNVSLAELKKLAKSKGGFQGTFQDLSLIHI